MWNRNSILLAWLLLALTVSAQAASILVNTADDELNNDGDCSLREAIQSANTNPLSGVDACNAGSMGADNILILVNGTIALANELIISEALSITGLGFENTVIAGGGQTRLIRINAPTDDILIEDLALVDGQTAGFLGGAAVLIECASRVRLRSVRMADNRAGGTGSGGAVLVNPDTDCHTRLDIAESIVRNNAAAGIGGALHINNVPLTGNESTRVDALSIETTLFFVERQQSKRGCDRGQTGAVDLDHRFSFRQQSGRPA